MEKQIPTYLLTIDEELSSDLQVDAVSLVDAPAIEKNFLAFNEHFVEPKSGEHQTDFIPKCISYVVGEGKDVEQATAICHSLWEQHFAGVKVSIDYDDTLSTDKGKALAKRLISEGKSVYIISARHDKEGMLSVAKDLGIPESKVYATGSNEAKVQKVKDLGITKHYDNNSDVVDKLGTIGSQFALKLGFAINADKQELFGPAMLAEVPIYRRDDQLGEYNVVFNKETIYAIAQKFFEKGFDKNFNLMHDASQKCSGVYVFQSYIVDNTEGRPAPKGYEDAKDGSWFLGVKVNNPEVWAKVKSGEIKGFSVEGVFEYKKKELSAEQMYKMIEDILSQVK
ncbi:Phage-like element PBSX protein, XkdF [uncultured Caudovirales phage]|uniref:Phage-like element PBSX protein, XkdF n=1 Tax=uncultured Caudovirales phage TaxID=2100421 RepID=A0A6J7WPI6_9CAUD|nr:Phage-like element PBSX protein, XkdF [uncultured Caudovirales phage]